MRDAVKHDSTPVNDVIELAAFTKLRSQRVLCQAKEGGARIQYVLESKAIQCPVLMDERDSTELNHSQPAHHKYHFRKLRLTLSGVVGHAGQSCAPATRVHGVSSVSGPAMTCTGLLIHSKEMQKPEDLISDIDRLR